MVVLSIDESISTFPAIDRTKEDSSELFKEMEKENDILKSLIDAIEKKFSKKKLEESEEIKKLKKTKKEDNIGSLVKNEELAQGQQRRYNLMEEFFSYLGKLKTTTNIYREHFIQYTEKKKEEDPLPQKAETQDMDYNEFEEMIRVKKNNDLFAGGASGGIAGGPSFGEFNGNQVLGASTKEKWEFLRLFAHYKVMAMIRYQFNST